MTRVRLRDVPVGPCVYLIHLHAPFKHARHYLGWSKNVRQRIRFHKNSHRDSCSFMKAVNAAGIKWHVARVWPGETQAFEHGLKDGGQITRLCPHCRKAALARNAANVKRARAEKAELVTQPQEAIAC